MLSVFLLYIACQVQVEHLASHFIQGSYIAFEVVDTMVYVATRRGLEIYTLNNAGIPQFIGRASTPGIAYGLCVRGHHVYVADEYYGLSILNASDPANPVMVGHYGTDFHTYDVMVTDTIAYLADGNGGLLIVNVADHAHPYYLGRYTYAGILSVSISVTDTLAFLGNWSGDPLLIINVADPTAPCLVSQLPQDGDHLPQGGDRRNNIWHACIVDTFAYLAGGWDFPGLGRFHFMVYNIADPSYPSFVSGMFLDQPASRVIVQGDYAYVNNQWWMDIIDVGDPATPFLVSTIDDALHYYITPALSGARLLTPEGSIGFSVYDVSDPYLPIRTYHHTPVMWQHFAVNDSLRQCYLQGMIDPSHMRLSYIDMADVYNPSVAADQTYLGLCPGTGPGLVAHDTLLAFGLERDNIGSLIGIVDVSDLAHPSLLRFEYGISCGPSILDPPMIGGGSGNRLMIGDLDATPLWIDSVATPGSCFAAAMQDTFAYAVGGGYLSRIDLNSLSLVNSYNLGYFNAGRLGGIFTIPSCLFVNYDALYIGYVGNGFLAFDISDPETLRLLSDTMVVRPLPFVEGAITIIPKNSCFLQDTLFYLVRDSDGFDVWNVRDQANPVRVLTQETPGNCKEIHARGDTIFALDDMSLEVYLLTGTGVAEYAPEPVHDIGLVVLPNPFRHTTKIRFTMQDARYTMENPSMTIYDAAGRQVKSFALESCIMDHESAVMWDGRDDRNNMLAQGVYFVRLSIGDRSATEKVVLLRR